MNQGVLSRVTKTEQNGDTQVYLDAGVTAKASQTALDLSPCKWRCDLCRGAITCFRNMDNSCAPVRSSALKSPYTHTNKKNNPDFSSSGHRA